MQLRVHRENVSKIYPQSTWGQIHTHTLTHSHTHTETGTYNPNNQWPCALSLIFFIFPISLLSTHTNSHTHTLTHTLTHTPSLKQEVNAGPTTGKVNKQCRRAHTSLQVFMTSFIYQHHILLLTFYLFINQRLLHTTSILLKYKNIFNYYLDTTKLLLILYYLNTT